MAAPSDSEVRVGGLETPQPLLVVDGVDKWFGERHVLQDIHLTISEHEVVALVGPPGSGKSTLCRALNRLEPVDGGRILFDGAPLPTEGRALAQLRADVAMVLPSFNLLANRSVLDNVTIGTVRVRRTTRPSAERRARAVLERVGLGHRGGAMPAELSDAEQQLAAIARAVALEPRVLLLDDPTANLDRAGATEVWEVVGDLTRVGTTMVVVTGELEAVRTVTQRVVFMAAGRIVEDAPQERFFAAPRSERARAFLADLAAG